MNQGPSRSNNTGCDPSRRRLWARFQNPVPRGTCRTGIESANGGCQLANYGSRYLLIVVAIIVGLAGHDPWKQDETYIFGIVQHILESGDWVVPTVAGEPFMEKPPMYYWVAALLSKAFSPWLLLHDGARLASGCFMALTCVTSGLTARRIWGQGAGATCVLVLLGCLGTVMYSHFMVTDLAVMAGFSLSLAAFPYADTHPMRAGSLLGCGVGMGFLGKGLLLPGVLGIACLLLPALFPAWRKRSYFYTLCIATVISLPAFLVWPTTLYLRSPELFHEWFWMNNVGRFLGFSVDQLGAPHRRGYWWTIMPWFAFPALPLAAVTLWKSRNILVRDQRVQFLVICCVVYMSTLALAASAREAYALPLLVALSLLATPAALMLPRRTDLGWTIISICMLGAIAATIWAVWLLAASGHPPDWAWLNRQIKVDPASAVVGAGFWLGIMMTFFAIFMVGLISSRTSIAITIWVTGLTLCWGLLATLWLPWIDAAKSYRQVFLALGESLPKERGCLASTGLGESERAMLHYVLGIDTQRTEIVGDRGCPHILVEGLARSQPRSPPSPGQRLLWQGARQQDARERFWLYGTQ